MTIRNLLAAAAAASLLPLSIAPATAATETASRTHDLLRSLGETLQGYYLDPRTAGEYARAVSDPSAAKSVAGLPDQEIAKSLTAMLKAVRDDAHLSVYAPGHGIYGKEDEDGEARLPDNPYEAAGWIAPNVAYVRPFAFFGRPQDVARMQAFVDTHADAKALIIDLRHHHGGEIDEADVLFADLFGKGTDLAEMRTRRKAFDRFETVRDTPTLFVRKRDSAMVVQTHRAVPRAGGARMAAIPVYVLTSRNSASAAEHVAMVLKSQGRAVLIGETTMGAGHYGSEIELTDGFKLFVPYGDTVDPKTGAGWEGVGISPDVAVPAKDALNVALQRLGLTAIAEPYPKL